MQCVAHEQSAGRACLSANIYLVDSSLTGSVQPLCPVIVQVTAPILLLQKQKILPILPLTVAIFRSEGGAAWQHLLWNG